MRKFYISILLVLLYSDGFSQAFVHNNGAGIYVKSGAFMIVNADSLTNDLNGTNGLIANSGVIVVEGDIYNNASIVGTNDSIKLTGDWVNNDAYSGNNSWVVMFGGNQLITGDSVTTFNNLMLDSAAVVKRQTLNAITTGLLVLNDAELATDSNQMLVTNTDSAAITWDSGFVSSVGPGMLARVTGSDSGYIFPLGSPSYVNPPSIFRPVQMAPVTNGSDTYGAALVKDNATNEGYNVDDLDTILCVVNPDFYHLLYHVSGNDAVALTMYFDASTDGNWTDEAHWQNSIWNYAGPSTAGTGLGLSTVTVAGINDFIPDPFALAQKKFSINPGPTDTITAGQSVVLHPTIIGPTDINLVWAPDSFLSCDNCDSPTASPPATIHYAITASDKEGCSVIDSLDVIVRISQFKMPNAFTPNGDGIDDLFGPATISPVTIKEFHIYNRWGQLVHNSNTYWDGRYKGDMQPAGVYVYYIEVTASDATNPSALETYKEEGSVTLLR